MIEILGLSPVSDEDIDWIVKAFNYSQGSPARHIEYLKSRPEALTAHQRYTRASWLLSKSQQERLIHLFRTESSHSFSEDPDCIVLKKIAYQVNRATVAAIK